MKLHRALLKAGVATALVTAAVPAVAQGQQSTEVETIIVTGTRIARPNLESASPLTVVGAEEVKYQGITRTEDLINSMPQVFAGQGGNIANGASGTATVDLRGLGPSRTMVLVNGRRLMPGNPVDPYPDLNTIPAALIERVDILTGGASTVYGSDAVAGVVNFVMDTKFEGFRVDAQYSFYQHHNDNKSMQELVRSRNFALPKGSVRDGEAYDLSTTIGVKTEDGRGHIVAYATYRKINQVLQANRDYSACAVNASGDGLVCAGSATSANGTFYLADDSAVTVGPGNTFVPWTSDGLFNYAPYNHYQRPDKRFTLGAFAHYEVSEHFTPYLELMFMDDSSIAQIAPSGDFGNTTWVNCDNPLMSDQQRDVVCTQQGYGPTDKAFLQVLRRNVEGGGRQDDLGHTSYRIVLGARGDIDQAWSYDLYGQYGKVNFAETYLRDFSVQRIQRALDVVLDPNTGQPVCRSVLDETDTACVPWDIFKHNGEGVTPEALAYLQTPGFQRGKTEELVVSGSVSGDLGAYGLQFPWANQGVGVAFGAEYRKEKLELRTDALFETGDLAGQGGPRIGLGGSFDVTEVFAESRIPIANDQPLAYDLALELGYRYSEYSTAGSTNTFKVLGEWAPVRDFRIRTGFNRAVRAPNAYELFRARSIGLDGSMDPCAGANPDATLAQCQLTGVTPGQYGNIAPNPANQYNGLLGGNPDLEPEKADTFTFGVVLSPSFLPRFSATIDFYDIKVKNRIGLIGADVIITQCINSGDPSFCSLIHRDDTGSLWRSDDGYIVDTYLNAGKLAARGIDISLNYSHEIGAAGSLRLDLVGSWLDRLTSELGDVKYDCAGLYGSQCGIPNPEWRHVARLTWASSFGLDLSLAWRHFGKVKVDTSSKDPDLAGTVYPANARIKAQNYFDLAAIYNINENHSLRAGVKNLFDKDPPIIGGQNQPAVWGSGNTFPQVYDALGRYFYIGGTFRF